MNIIIFRPATAILLTGLIILLSMQLTEYNKSPANPVSWWKLDRYETDHITDRVTGISDLTSRRFHYTLNNDGELIRYPTYIKRSGGSVPQLTGSFSIEAWIAPQEYAPHWNPVVDQGNFAAPGDIPPDKKLKGLAGVKFGDTELSRVVDKDPIFLDNFANDWNDGDNDWSGRWCGYIEAPFTGKVRFIAEADDGIRLKIGRDTIIDGWGKGKERTGSIYMVRGELYPLVLEYYRDGGESYLRLFWEFDSMPRTIIPANAVSHTGEQLTIAEKGIKYQPVFPLEKTRLSFGMGTDGKPGLKLNMEGKVQLFSAERSLPLKTWSHIAVTFDGKESVKFFINGYESGTSRVTSKFISNKGGDLHIGRSHREDDKPYSLKEFTGIIGSVRLFDDQINRRQLDSLFREQKAEYQKSAETVKPFRNIEIYNEPGRFAGWPANGGIWVWDEEIAFGFEANNFRDQPDAMDGHSHDGGDNTDFIARSKDGGETWAYKKYPVFDPPEDSIIPFTGSMEFTHPGFAFMSRRSRFYYSYDRGQTWKGPFRLKVEGIEQKLSARTDYLVKNAKSASFFLSVDPDGKEDRAFCAYSSNGGKTLKFRGWMTDPSPEAHERWVMPSTVRLSETYLVSAVRRKINLRRYNAPDSIMNWIDVYQSPDNGKTWEFLSKVAKTGDPGNPYNGNPPSMIRLDDGRLCVTYAVRNVPGRICAKISTDNGKTWEEEIILRQDARNWDIGYTRSMQRTDGQVVTVYYFATPENRNQFIAATIWDPDIKISGQQF